MLKQAIDFKNESDDLYNLLKEFSHTDFQKNTLFKDWTFNTILRHLHVWNYAAKLTLTNKIQWENFYDNLQSNFKGGKNITIFEKDFTKNLSGRELLVTWKKLYNEISEKFKLEDPKRRVKWVGPDMSVISAISARHMETWAHGQAIFDKLGLKRKNEDRIINIVIIGKNTFNWSFKVNGLDIPEKVPSLSLVSPSGELWEFNDKNNSNHIEGLAEEFCQVVTQVRNIKDLNLKVRGSISRKWMSIAQCFAGKAQKPPEPGYRKIKKI